MRSRTAADTFSRRAVRTEQPFSLQPLPCPPPPAPLYTMFFAPSAFKGRDMLSVTFSEEERAELAAVLEEYLSELRMEMADTDRMDYREMLKERKRRLVGILHAVTCTEDAAAAG